MHTIIVIRLTRNQTGQKFVAFSGSDLIDSYRAYGATKAEAVGNFVLQHAKHCGVEVKTLLARQLPDDHFAKK